MPLVVFQQQNLGDFGSMRHLIAISGEETTGRVDLAAIWPRLLCYLMVNTIPEKGLEELYGTLKNMSEFYSVPDAPRSLTAATRINGVITHAYERPPFTIAEE